MHRNQFYCLVLGIYIQSRKVKLSLSIINEAPSHGDVLWSGDIAAPFLNLTLVGGELSASWGIEP
jgi:hypothetical protein